MSINIHTCLPGLMLSGEKTLNCTGGIAVQSLLTEPKLDKSSGSMVKNKSSTASVTGCLSLLSKGEGVTS